jgi:MFS family permease
MACVLNFLNFAGMWMLPAMLPLFIHSTGAPTYMLGWVVGLTAIATIITRPLAGLAVDRFGRRGVFSVGTIGMLVTAVGFAIMPFYGAILAIRFVQGLAWGFTNTSCTTIGADNIAKSRYAEGLGWFSLASSLAMVLSPALSLTLFYAVGGTASSLVCAGFFLLSLLCSCFVTYHTVDAKVDRGAVDKRSELDRGVGLDREVELDRETPNLSTLEETDELSSSVSPLGSVSLSNSEQIDELSSYTSLSTSAPNSPRRKIAEFIKETLFEKSALLAALLMMLTASSYGIVQSFLSDMLDNSGAHDYVAAFFIVMAVAALGARPAFGRWADARGYFMPAFVSFICMSASMVLLAWSHELSILVVAAILQGVGYSAGFSLFMALATRHAKPRRRGTAIATVMVGFDAGSGLTAIGLSFVAFSLGYAALFIGGAIIALLGTLVLLVRRESL